MLKFELAQLVGDICAQTQKPNHIEIKEADVCFPEVHKTLSSFSNNEDGGIILFGMKENAGYEICGVYNPFDFQRQLESICLQMEPPVKALCTATQINEKYVVSAEIPEIDIFHRPCFYKEKGRQDGSYIRINGLDVQMTEHEIHSCDSFRRNKHDELRIIGGTRTADIYGLELDKYFINLKTMNDDLSHITNEKILRLHGITSGNELALAGIILFSNYPQATLPSLYLSAEKVPGEGNVRIEGTLSQMLDQTVSFVERNMSVSRIIHDGSIDSEDTDYPMPAIREAILNALIHRDYSVYSEHTPIRLVMYDNRIEISNPGGLYGRLTPDTLGKIIPDTRNPLIVQMMEVLGASKHRYSGIPTIRRIMKLHGLPEPVFEVDRETFKVTLMLTHDPS